MTNNPRTPNPPLQRPLQRRIRRPARHTPLQAIEDVLAQLRRHLLDCAPCEIHVHFLVQRFRDSGDAEALKVWSCVAHPGPPVADVEVAHYEGCGEIFAVLEEAGAFEAQAVSGVGEEGGEVGACGHYEGFCVDDMLELVFFLLACGIGVGEENECVCTWQ